MVVVYPASALQALQWEPLSSISARTSVSSWSPHHVDDAYKHLAQALRKKRWLLEENQHIAIPPTNLDRDHTSTSTGGRIFSMGDFVHRTDRAIAADLQLSAVDNNKQDGSRCSLSSQAQQQQLKELKRTGELTVKSAQFENQHHTWKVAPGFYSGTDTVKQSFQEGLGKTLDHAVVYTGDSVTGNNNRGNNRKLLLRRPNLLSVVNNGLFGALKMLRGGAAGQQLFASRLQHPTYSERDIQAILDEAERGYVEHFLQSEEHDTRRLYEWKNQKIMHIKQHETIWDILQQEDTIKWGTDYCPTASFGEREVAQRRIFNVQQNFDIKMRALRIAKLKVDKATAERSPKAAINEMRDAEAKWREEKEKLWLDQLRNDTDLKELGQIEADRLAALKIEEDVNVEDDKKTKNELKEYEDLLRRRRPILSLSNEWRQRKIAARRAKISASFDKSRPERVALRLETEDLEAQSSARKHAAKFRSDDKEGLAKSLRSKRSPLPPAKFQVLQLNPNHWSGNANGGFDRYKTVEVSLNNPFWRGQYTWMTFVTWTKGIVGGAYHFLASGPLSLRALFSPRAYYAVERPSRDPSSLTETMTSRLQSFWRALRGARERFEATPDRGLIGKSIQRFFLRITLAVKGVVGTLGIVLFMTVGTVVASALNLVVFTAAPVVAALVTIVGIVFNLTIYDFAVKRAQNRYRGNSLDFGGIPEMTSAVSPLIKIVFYTPYYLIVPGVLQGVLAIARLGVYHPLRAASHLVWASLRFTLRKLRDCLTWPLIRKYSRIPSENSFLAWRVHGPGLALTEYYRLPVEAVKASVLLLLDKYRLEAYAQVRRAELAAPYVQYRDLFRSVVEPFGLDITMNVTSPHSVASRLTSACQFPNEQGGMYRSNHHSRAPPLHEHGLDIWSAVADGIRSSHPEYQQAHLAYASKHWEASSSQSTMTDKAMDEAIRSELASIYEHHKIAGSTELAEMVNRAAKVLAELNLAVQFREQRLTYAVAIPEHAAGRFRWSTEEQDEIWKFTCEAVEIYGKQLADELDSIIFVSEFPAKIQPTVAAVTEAFYARSGARPGQDIPTVASFLLVQLLGGEDMLETLETLDETLVLRPKLAEEDEHLVFWKSFGLGLGLIAE